MLDVLEIVDVSYLLGLLTSGEEQQPPDMQGFRRYRIRRSSNICFLLDFRYSETNRNRPDCLHTYKMEEIEGYQKMNRSPSLVEEKEGHHKMNRTLVGMLRISEKGKSQVLKIFSK